MNIDSLEFAEFLQEGMFYVDGNTPTIINAGGCGIFAKELYNELSANNINCKIFTVAADIKAKKEKLRNFILTNGIEDRESSFSHIFIKVEDVLFVDSDGIMKGMVDNPTMIEISYPELINFIENAKTWNPIYDRDCDSKIQSLLNEVFSHLKDFHPGIFKKIPRSLRLTKKTIEGRQSSMMSSVFG